MGESNGDGNIDFSYDITVPAGGTTFIELTSSETGRKGNRDRARGVN